MKFTRTEWEIIVHRLKASDAITEALTDHCEGDEPATYYGPIAIEDAVYMLLLNGCKREIFSDVEIIVLRECCEGSTFFAGIDDAVATGEITTGYKLSCFRAAKSLGEKLNVTVVTI